jgi:SAM-dependent methyltransferase
VLAPRELPEAYAKWNRAHHAPAGRTRALTALRLRGNSSRALAWYRTPYGWQGNNTIRAFEYPWAHTQIGRLGTALDIVDVGGSLSGLQFTLASEGHRVVNVDPGIEAEGLGWEVSPRLHARLSGHYKAPVRLVTQTIGGAGLADNSVDVLLSISTIEHLTGDDVAELGTEVRRVLRPRGRAVLTVDLFLDLHPFTTRQENEFGRNIDVRGLLSQLGLELEHGNPAELCGYPQFDPDAIQAKLADYLLGRYPALAQCVVARPTAR